MFTSLFRLFGAKPAAPTLKARLGLDAFEDRVVPASVSFDSGVLFISADQATDDAVSVTAVGASADGSTGVTVSSSLTGDQPVTFGDAEHPVTTVALDLKDGNDTVSVASLASVVVLVGEGNGNNSVSVGDTLAGGVIAGSGQNDITVGNGTMPAFGSFNLSGLASSVAFIGYGYVFTNGGTAFFLNGLTGNDNNNTVHMTSAAGFTAFVDIVGDGSNNVHTGDGNDGVSVIGDGNNRVHVGTGVDTVVVTGNGSNIVWADGSGSITVTGTGVNAVKARKASGIAVALNGAAEGSSVVVTEGSDVSVDGIVVTESGTVDGITVRFV